MNAGLGFNHRGPHLPSPSPAHAPRSGHSVLRADAACCLVCLVSRHFKVFGWDTRKVNRDALWDLKQKSKGRVFSLVFTQRGGELLNRESAFCQDLVPRVASRPGDVQERKQKVRAVEGSKGSDTEGVLLMASSTSDFWREVLKTPS